MFTKQIKPPSRMNPHPDEFGGTDEESHYMSQQSAKSMKPAQETVKIHDDEFEGGSMCNDYDPYAIEQYEKSKMKPQETVKHTAGPWYRNKGSGQFICRTVEQPEKNIICRVDRGVREWEANAELIARAPQMAKEIDQLKFFIENESRRLAESVIELEQLRAEKERLRGLLHRCSKMEGLLREVSDYNSRHHVFGRNLAERITTVLSESNPPQQ